MAFEWLEKRATMGDIIPALISAAVYVVTVLWVKGKDERDNLNRQLDEILKISIQYPYLESEIFTNAWSPNFDRNDEKYLRYDVYCILVFNFLYRVAEHFKYDKRKIENYIDVKNWLKIHAEYWKNTSESENMDGYGKKFVEFIDSYLKK